MYQVPYALLWHRFYKSTHDIDFFYNKQEFISQPKFTQHGLDISRLATIYINYNGNLLYFIIYMSKHKEWVIRKLSMRRDGQDSLNIDPILDKLRSAIYIEKRALHVIYIVLRRYVKARSRRWILCDMDLISQNPPRSCFNSKFILRG